MALGRERRVASSEMAGKKVLWDRGTQGRGPLRVGDIFSEEGMKSWRREEVRSSRLAECTGRQSRIQEKDLRSI